MIGRWNTVAIDCPDPRALAAFYGALMDMTITDEEPDWIDIEGGGHRLSFQLAPDLEPPRWPDPQWPQQMHLDIEVDDIAAAEPQVLALGATLLSADADGFRVYADPAGHPFCLVRS